MMTRQMTVALALATLIVGSAEAQTRSSRDSPKHWRAETPYWELLRRQREREAIIEEMTPPADSDASKRDAAPTDSDAKKREAEPAAAPINPLRDQHI